MRYFARSGDTGRYTTEVARLRSLYPDWAPPDDPLKAALVTDPRLEYLWQLYAQGQFAAARDGIASRRSAQPQWVPPKDLVDRLAIAESRERLVNVSNARQFKMVIDLAATTPSLLTCGDVDVLWRLAEAFGRTGRRDRMQDVYRYILTRCTDPHDRLATMQKAMSLLNRSEFEPLLVLGNGGSDGDEFRSVREGLARNAVAVAGADPKILIETADLKLMQEVATANGSASDALLMGGYFLHRDPAQSENWYRLSLDRQKTAASAEGLALALMALKRPAEAESVLVPWWNANEGTRKSYLAVIANLLAMQPPPILTPDVLTRVVTAVAAQRDVPSAQQLGWYAHAFKQDVTALRWFATALSWKPDDEPSAYGFAVASQSLNRRDALHDVVKVWGSRSLRIRAMVDPAAAKELARKRDANAQTLPDNQGQLSR